MTFEKLLELSAEELESISEERLLEILTPVLNNYPPVELEKVRAYEEREKARKDELKEKKKLEKKIEKEAKKLEEEKTKPTTIIPTKIPRTQKKHSMEELKQMSEMLKQLQQTIK